MRFPIIKVRDKASDNRIHIVGTNTHDTLDLAQDGQIHYYNLQNGEGTFGDYEFVAEDNGLGTMQIEFVGLPELIEIIKNQDVVDEERKRAMEELIKLLP